MQIAPFTLVRDAGHGWLAVPVTELTRLGIRSQISSCSPEKDGLQFLEGDCDMETFLHALDARGEQRPAVEHLQVEDFWPDVMGRPRYPSIPGR